MRSLVAALSLAWLAVARLASAEGDPQLVTKTSAGYSIDAFDTNVVELLSQVGQHAGFTVQAPESFNSSITLDVTDAPLDQVLRRVLRNENYIIVYRGGVQKTAISGEGIDKIFLLSQASGQAPRPVAGPATGVSPLAGPGAPAPGAPPRVAPQNGMSPADLDLAARAAEARARAEARRAALGQTMPNPPPPAPPAARMVEQPGDFTPPPPNDTGEIVDPDLHAGGGVPPADVPPDGAGDVGTFEEDY